MGKIDIVAELEADNPAAKRGKLILFAEAARIWAEATENIRKNGAVCVHPKTSAPIENPYLKVQAAQAAMMLKIRGIDGGRVLDLLTEG